MALAAVSIVGDAVVKHARGSALAAALAIGGVAAMILGAMTMHRPQSIKSRNDSAREGAVPWDWSDFVMFWPASFAAATFLNAVAVPLVDASDAALGADTQLAARSFTEQAVLYASALFNLYVLVGLRRGGRLRDLGWRGFRWWWIPIAAACVGAALKVAEYLQELSARIFPTAQNSQCVTVRHDYSHSLVLAIVVVCVLAPLAEETIFRGFVYGWLRRWTRFPIAIPISGVIFATLHQELLILLPLFAVGCILAALYQGSRSICPAF